MPETVDPSHKIVDPSFWIGRRCILDFDARFQLDVIVTEIVKRPEIDNDVLVMVTAGEGLKEYFSVNHRGLGYTIYMLFGGGLGCNIVQLNDPDNIVSDILSGKVEHRGRGHLEPELTDAEIQQLLTDEQRALKLADKQRARKQNTHPKHSD